MNTKNRNSDMSKPARKVKPNTCRQPDHIKKTTKKSIRYYTNG